MCDVFGLSKVQALSDHGPSIYVTGVLDERFMRISILVKTDEREELACLPNQKKKEKKKKDQIREKFVFFYATGMPLIQSTRTQFHNLSPQQSKLAVHSVGNNSYELWAI